MRTLFVSACTRLCMLSALFGCLHDCSGCFTTTPLCLCCNLSAAAAAAASSAAFMPTTSLVPLAPALLPLLGTQVPTPSAQLLTDPTAVRVVRDPSITTIPQQAVAFIPVLCMHVSAAFCVLINAAQLAALQPLLSAMTTPLPPDASSSLFIENLPADATEREVSRTLTRLDLPCLLSIADPNPSPCLFLVEKQTVRSTVAFLRLYFPCSLRLVQTFFGRTVASTAYELSPSRTDPPCASSSSTRPMMRTKRCSVCSSTRST
jgi:hypothetical protein